MSEITLSWNEITIAELIDLAESLHGVLLVDGDKKIAVITYEAEE